MKRKPTESTPESNDAAGVEHLFDRVVCAVDGSPASTEAARQADALVPPGCTLELVTIVSEAELDGTWGEGYSLGPGSVPEHLDPALRALPDTRPVEASPIYRSGPLGSALVEALSEKDATLVALAGSHRHAAPHFLDSLLHGDVVARLVHDAPCSVLIARPGEDGQRRFDTIAAGFDGSPGGAAALETAQALASRLGASLTVVAADGVTPPPNVTAPVVEDPRGAVDALVEAGADLLVLGSRRRHGVHAHGGVGDRVAERAGSSVLIVRG